jgi:hypothetical protein
MEMWEKMANSTSGWESFISLIWLYVIITSCILISPSWLHVSCLVFPFSDMSVEVVVSCFFDLYLFYNGMYFHVFFTYKFFWKIIFPMFLLVFWVVMPCGLVLLLLLLWSGVTQVIPNTVIISDLLCIPVSVRIIPDSSTRALAITSRDIW